MFNFNSPNLSPFTWVTALTLAAIPPIALVLLASAGGADRAGGRVNFQLVPAGVWNIDVRSGEFVECRLAELSEEVQRTEPLGDIHSIGGEWLTLRGDDFARKENDDPIRYWGEPGSIYDCILFDDVYDWTQNRRHDK